MTTRRAGMTRRTFGRCYFFFAVFFFAAFFLAPHAPLWLFPQAISITSFSLIVIRSETEFKVLEDHKTDDVKLTIVNPFPLML